MTLAFEAFLASIYVDPLARQLFLANPRRAAGRAGLDEREIQALERIDRAGLELVAASLQRKRRGRREP